MLHTHETEKEMDSKTLLADKPHAVCIPIPAQSHMTAMLKLSKLLHHEGFHITFINTEFNHQRFLKSRGPNYSKPFRTAFLHQISTTPKIPLLFLIPL